MEILASRVLFRPADYERSLAFYRDGIGLAVAREYGAGTVLYAGQSLIELAGHGAPPADAPPFPGALWLQVRDVYATQAELEGRGVEIAAVGQTGTVGSARNARHGSRRGDAHLRAGPRGAPATSRHQTLTAAVPAAGFEPARSRSRKPALYPLSYAGRRGTPGENRTPTAGFVGRHSIR